MIGRLPPPNDAPSITNARVGAKIRSSDCTDHQELVQVPQQERGGTKPLGRLPADVQPIVLAFLSARELSSVRRLSRDFLRLADAHAELLWGSLCRFDFPSMKQERAQLSPHQRYVNNVLRRANDEACNLRANYRLRESLDEFTCPIYWPPQNSNATMYSAIRETFGTTVKNLRLGSSSRNDININANGNRNSNNSYGSSNGNSGVIGLVSDLVTIPDQRIARAISHKRRTALSTVVVDNDKVLFEFRRRGVHTGPVNFLPLSTLGLENPTPPASLLLAPLLLEPPAGNNAALAVASAGDEDRDTNSGGGGQEELGNNEEGANLLPLAPEMPAPTGFLGYAARLLRLRPEHERLRWTVLFALFKDLAVFETTAQAEAVRSRLPDQRLFYCTLDHPGAQDDTYFPEISPLPHISHWGFPPPLVGNGGGGGLPGAAGDIIRAGETVGDAVERQERIACFARSSLEFIQCGNSPVDRGR